MRHAGWGCDGSRRRRAGARGTSLTQCRRGLTALPPRRAQPSYAETYCSDPAHLFEESTECVVCCAPARRAHSASASRNACPACHSWRMWSAMWRIRRRCATTARSTCSRRPQRRTITQRASPREDTRARGEARSTMGRVAALYGGLWRACDGGLREHERAHTGAAMHEILHAARR